MIPIGVRYRALAEGSVARFVTCEQCGQGYGYWLDRTTMGTASSYFLIGRDGASQRAWDRAKDTLRRRLQTECDAVPCPHCGWYQEHMIAQARHEKYGWLVRAGWIAAIAA